MKRRMGWMAGAVVVGLLAVAASVASAEKTRVALRFEEALTEAQVKRAADAVEVLKGVESFSAHAGSAEAEVVVKGGLSVSFSVLEAVLKKADVKLEKSDLAFKGTVNLWITLTSC